MQYTEEQLANLAQFGQTEVPYVSWEQHKAIQAEMPSDDEWLKAIHEKRLREEPEYAAKARGMDAPAHKGKGEE